MSGRIGRLVLAAVAVVAMAAAGGCAPFAKQSSTYISVQVAGDTLLHLAIVPRVLPNGDDAAAARDKLLAEVAEHAGGYTYIESVMGAWMPPGKGEVVKETNDLLLVQGTPDIAYLLRLRLFEDFDQQVPFVISLPIQSVAVVEAVPPEVRKGAEPKPEEAAAQK